MLRNGPLDTFDYRRPVAVAG